MNKGIKGWSGALSLALAVGGCGGGTTTNTNADMAVKAEIKLPPLTVETMPMVNAAADEACVTTPMVPPARTMPTVVNGSIEDFQDNNKVKGAIVKIYFTTDQALHDMPVAMSAATDDMGKFTLTIPPGPARIIRSNAGGLAISAGNMVKTIPTFEFNVIAEDTKPTAVKESTKEAIPGLVGITQMDGLGVLAGGVRDCQNRETQGANVHVTVEGHPEYSDDGLIFYFLNVQGAGNVPVRSQKYTSVNGAFAALNVTPGVATVTDKGVLMAGGMAQTLSTYKVPVIADSVTIIELSTGILQ